VVLLILIAFAALCVGLLSVPLDLSFGIQKSISWRVRMSVRWMFGLVRFPVSKPGIKPARGAKSGVPERTVPRKHRPLRRTSRILRIFRRPDFLRRFLQLAAELLGAVRPRDFRLRLCVGFDDPAETGWLCAVANPLAILVNQHQPEALQFMPDFSGERLEVDARGDLRVFPAELVWFMLKFLLSSTTQRALWRASTR
jgi:hypothetical protein